MNQICSHRPEKGGGLWAHTPWTSPRSMVWFVHIPISLPSSGSTAAGRIAAVHPLHTPPQQYFAACADWSVGGLTTSRWGEQQAGRQQWALTWKLGPQLCHRQWMLMPALFLRNLPSLPIWQVFICIQQTKTAQPFLALSVHQPFPPHYPCFVLQITHYKVCQVSNLVLF